MPLRLSNIRLGVDESELALPERLAEALEVRPGDIQRWRILRKSLDARNKDDLAFVYSAEVVVPDSEATLIERTRIRRPDVGAELFEESPFQMPSPGQQPLRERPVVVGSGPAGLSAAYFLAEQRYRPLVLERGKIVHDRIDDIRAFDRGGPHDPESNYLFGEGGAGTFSDGKLTCRNSGPDVRRILQLFAECKGKPSILYEYRPHLGSNRLPAVVKALRQRIQALGGEFRFQCRLEDLDLAEGRIRGLVSSSGYLPASVVLLAIGHSARDTYEMLLRRGVPMTPKAFQIGVRIEQPQEQVNRVQYGQARLEEKLGAADYALVARGQSRDREGAVPDLFTFCMCAGGQVIPSVSEPGYFGTNGMSLSRRDSGFANSGLMVTLEPSAFGGKADDVLAGVRLQREFEAKAFAAGQRDYLAPVQWAGDFLARRRTRGKLPSSYQRGVAPADVAELTPALVVAALVHGLPVLDRRWRGRFLLDATLVGPESRGSAPIRVLREELSRESPGVGGLYPVGEGAGYAGGIISAAVDGLRSARAIVARYAPLDARK